MFTAAFSNAPQAVAQLQTPPPENDNALTVDTLLTETPIGDAPMLPFADDMLAERAQTARILSANRTDGIRAGAGRTQYLPFAYAVPQALPTDLVSFEPNNSSCQAIGPLRGNTTYQAAFESNDFDDWFYYDVSAGSNIRLRGTNIPKPNQFQLFFASGIGCSAIPGTPNAKVDDQNNPDLTVSSQAAGRLFVRVVGIKGSTSTGRFNVRVEPSANTGAFEDNDTPCQATKTTASTGYTTYVDDDYDFFEVNITAAGTVKIQVTGYPVPSQLQLRTPIKTNGGCDAVTSTDRIGEPGIIVNGNAEVVAYLTPGVYYARMGPPNGTRTGQAYNFSWSFTAGTQPIQTDTCAPFAGCNGNAAGAKFTLYWRNMPGGAKATVQLASEAVSTCPKTTVGEGTYAFDAASGAGTREFTGIGRGFFKLKITVRNSAGTQLYYNEHPIKMDCDFASALAAPDVAATPAP